MTNVLEWADLALQALTVILLISISLRLDEIRAYFTLNNSPDSDKE